MTKLLPALLAEDHIFDDEGSCWCCPTVYYQDPVTGSRVWVHKDSEDSN